MTPFLAAQATDPFDPAPMLIHADWLEEHGDQVGAAVLRGLAAAGIASLVALALDAGAVLGREVYQDRFQEIYGVGLGDRLGLPGGSGPGHGDDFGTTLIDGAGDTLRGDLPGFGFGGGDDHPSFSGGSTVPHGNGEGRLDL